MYQNPQRSSKIFTPIFPSAVSTQILTSQANVNPALQLSQPAMVPQTYASQVVVPQVQTLAPPVQSIVPQVQSVVPQVQSVVPQVQSVVPQVQSIVPQVQSVVPQVQAMPGYAPMAQAPTLVNYVMPLGSRYLWLKIIWDKILPISMILEEVFMEEFLLFVKKII